MTMLVYSLPLVFSLFLSNLLCSYPGKGPFLFSNMQYQAFPNSGKPGALLYIPSILSSQPSINDLNIVVFIHGWSNCVANCVLSESDNHNCSVSAPKREAYGIIDQLERSKVPAILLAPEVAYDQQSSSAGEFAKKNRWQLFLNEFLQRSSGYIGKHSLDSIKRILVFSHSGGYNTIASILSDGGVPQTREAFLLDSLYARTSDFDNFITKNIKKFGNGVGLYRYGNVYTDNGGTYSLSIDQAKRAGKWTDNSTKLYLFDNTYSTLPPTAYKHPILFKRSALSHNGVPRYYVEKFLEAF